MAVLIPLVMIVLLWAVVILPQQRRLRAHRAFVTSVAVGDEVVTTAGVYGTIRGIDDERVALEIAPGVVITIARLAIGERQPTLEPSALDADPTDEASEQ